MGLTLQWRILHRLLLQGRFPPSVSHAHSPNVAFKRAVAARARSLSPRPRRPASPLGISVAQCRAQLAAQSAATAVSGVGRVEAETQRVRAMVNATSAEAKSVRSEVETRIATLATAAETNAARVATELGEQLKNVAEYAEAQTSRTAVELSQRLGSEINAAATSATATAELTTRTMVEGARRDIQAQLDANRAEALRRYEETQRSVQGIAAQLQSLTGQLSKLNPASVSGVAEYTGDLENKVQQKFDQQQQNIQTLTDAIAQSQKESKENADTLNNLLVGMENLGENMMQMQEELLKWREQEYEQMEAELMAEVPIPSQTKPQEQNPPEVPIPTGNIPVSHTFHVIPEEGQVRAQSITTSEMDRDIQARWSKLTTMQTAVNPSTGPSVTIGGISQATIPQFFGSTIQPVPNSVPSIPLHPHLLAPVEPPKTGAQVLPRRITPERVTPEVPNARANGGESSGETIDLLSGTSVPSKGSGSMFGTTEIPDDEAQAIKKEIQAVMAEQVAEGRAALRATLGLLKEESMKIEAAARMGRPSGIGTNSSDPEGMEVPRSSFGSPVSVTNATPSAATVSSANPSFATAAWKPKEPPCFFGRSAEDAHTWVSLVRNYLTFMSGSDAQQVAYTVTLFRDAAHEWYCAFERRNRGPPRDWASLVAALLDRFGSNIRSQEAQSQLMSISQGQRTVRDYASQFETLLGRLDSYDEGQMLNQFVWGLQPDLARSVSLHYPRTIAKAVSLAETTELAIKASRRPGWKSSTTGNLAKGPNSTNRGRGQWKGNRGGGRGGYRGGRSSMGSARGNSRGRGGRASQGSVNFDPLACYRCGVRGHLAHDCPQAVPSQGSVNAGPSRGTFSRSGATRPKE